MPEFYGYHAGPAMGIYLDYNASTPVDDRVLDKMIDVYRNHFGNADSRTHQFGQTAKTIVENARRQVGRLLGASPEMVCFTSGSTESNNMAVLGLEEYGLITGRRHIITTAIEHKSILEPCRHLAEKGFEIETVRPKEDGKVDTQDVLGRVRNDTLLVSVMHVNNETGTIQPVDEIGDALKHSEVYVHVDASQSCGKLVDELRELSYDFLSVSAHKMYGPQGIGALIINTRNGKSPALRPIMYGGGQERNMRPGTLPTALIAGMGEAAAIAEKEYKINNDCFIRNKQIILDSLNTSGVCYQINGDMENSIHNTLNVSFSHYDSEALMLAMQEANLAGISNGSACTSHNYAPSYVLQAMGLDEERISSSVRISWGKDLIDKRILDEMMELIKAWQIV